MYLAHAVIPEVMYPTFRLFKGYRPYHVLTVGLTSGHTEKCRRGAKA